jgi:crotonobetainyl-CoA:carnitine CoA-transferase CaiB-like acyl-CoA transferase
MELSPQIYFERLLASSSPASPTGARVYPTRGARGFGTLVEGMSGFASMNGFADREPVLPPIYLGDMIAGLYGPIGIAAFLREVEV